MPYRIKCDGQAILDLRDDDLIVANPTVSLENNTVGVGSFTIYKNHPNFGVMHHMKSIFEVRDDVGVIFRGRMTDDTVDFDYGKAVELEGVGAFLNDSIVRPYKFPDDFLNDDRYIAAAGNGGNVVEFFLRWLIDNHNAQVESHQRFKLGVVSVWDSNNYITRENTGYESTWANIESRLFNSSLGGFLCFRYEDDGNYVDYLADFTRTNAQAIVLGQNMLDLSGQTSAQETYSAIIPLGKENDNTKTRLTIAGLANGHITDDVVKDGDMIYSVSAVARYGKICVVGDYNDITEAENLLDKAVEQLADGVMLSNTVEVNAVDLHLSDAAVESFRMYQNVSVRSATHGLSAVYRLSKLTIPLLNPSGTEIVAGKTQKTLTAYNAEKQKKVQELLGGYVTGDDLKSEIQKVTQSAHATGYIYNIGVGESFDIAYVGNSPDVECPNCLTWYDDGGLLVFTGKTAGNGTIYLRDGDTLIGAYSVKVVALQTQVYDYTIAVGETIDIAYNGRSPSVECPSCLEYYDDGGLLVFTAIGVGVGTINLYDSDTLIGEYNVKVIAATDAQETETWTFTYEDGSTRAVEVCVK